MTAPILSRLVRRALIVTTAATSLVSAQSRQPGGSPTPPPANPDSALRIVLLTMGQGDQVYEFFGHNAIWIHDPGTRTDTVYNWGVFDFATPGFVPRFLMGDMRYIMAGETVQQTLARYQYLNRRVWAQELDLTPAEKRALTDFVRWNALPENRQYRYDYYLDNCSTRVRDVIDRVVGGQLRPYLRGIPTDQTYRSHSLRLMQGAPLLVTGVELVLGRPTDTLLNADQASFLPVQLMNYVKGFRLDGGRRALVKREWLFSEAARGPEPASVPALWKWYLPVGLVVAAALLGLFALRARIATTVSIAVVAGIIGIIGTILVLLMTVTDHVAAHRNENLWMLNPVWVVVAIALPMAVARGRGRVARWATAAAAGLSLGAVLMHFVGLSHQPNWDVIALLLPPQLAMAFIAVARRAAPVNDPV